MTDAEARAFAPHVVHVDAGQPHRRLGSDPAAALLPGVGTPPFAVTH